ncbi:hypothetical protein DERP_001719 [Dermatophagoides pteronyssinus]|uniref:Uncharacterized protein n=1 Tax=Dermatophagoides pteronyssinus TaxID=6956 RepID=A0ABQ8JBA7_DERPT|nr:hypothetical protein DERP_001719 [Dermatophagoides pteronyssinus]
MKFSLLNKSKGILSLKFTKECKLNENCKFEQKINKTLKEKDLKTEYTKSPLWYGNKNKEILGRKNERSSKLVKLIFSGLLSSKEKKVEE